MATSVNDIVQGAIGMSVQNNAAGLTSDAPEMIRLVGQYQRDVYIAAARANRYFADTGTVTSTAAASNRTADLATLTTLERVVRASIAAGALHRVDLEDTDAELPPRYTVFGATMAEVGADWGATGAVTITVQFATKPAALSPTGGLAQTLTLPDDWCPILTKRLAAYLSRKDVGREAAEADAFETAAATEMAAMMESLAHYAGTARRRFLSPEPATPGSE